MTKTTQEIIADLQNAHPSAGSFSFKPEIFQEAASRLEALENANKELFALLERHYSFAKPCGHNFCCICLQDDSKAALSKHATTGQGE